MAPGVASCVYVSPPRGSAVGSGAFFWPVLQRKMVCEVGTRNEQLALDEVVVYEVAHLTPGTTDGRKGAAFDPTFSSSGRNDGSTCHR